MKVATLLWFSLFVALSVSPVFAQCMINGSDLAVDPANCPDDLAQHIEWEDACSHLSGEISGNPNSQRDEEVYKSMNELHCGEPLYCARQALIKKYAAQKPVYDTTLRLLKEIHQNDYADQM